MRVLTAPHSPRRHQKLNLRMKSFSLDESGEHFQGGGVGPGGGGPQGGGGHYHHHHRDRDNPYGNQGPYDSYQQATPLRQQQQHQHSASAGSVASSGGGGGGGSGTGSGHLYLPSTGGSGSFIRRASATICGSSGVAGQRNMYSHRASNPNVTTAIITGSNSSAHNSQASSYSQCTNQIIRIATSTHRLFAFLTKYSLSINNTIFKPFLLTLPLELIFGTFNQFCAFCVFSFCCFVFFVFLALSA